MNSPTNNQLQTIATDQIVPNDWNPNQMTDEEFQELVAEVKHLGRLPKPVIVRQNCDGYQIIDGEHGWRAAKEIGLTTVACEITKDDDFESMRQTYKRNQHGTHNLVRLGQMFQRMMKERGISGRQMANEIQVSEGTVRNMIEYAKAAERVRNHYAPPVHEWFVAQVRAFNELPEAIIQLWNETEGKFDELFNKDQMSSSWDRGRILCQYQSLAKSPVLPHLQRTKDIRHNSWVKCC